MRINAIRAYSRNLALTKPYTIAYQTTTKVENVFLEIELANGTIGLGAANPDPEVVGESPEQTLQNLQSEWIMGLVGRDIRLFTALIDEARQQFPSTPGTLAALDIALHDAFGQYLGVPIVQFYGQKLRSLPTSVTIGIMNVADTLTEASGYAELGFRVLKVKTGLHVEEDVERILKLRETYGNKMTLRVDANQGYSIADLERFLAATRSANVELIEQPLPVGRELDLLVLPEETRQLLAADESLKDAKMALTLTHQPQPFGIFNIKLMKCGGIRAALNIATIAHSADISLFWGCNDESRISIAAALHAAFACSNTRYLDLDGSLDLAEDVVSGGFMLEDGLMRPTNQAGLGVERIR
ncbi:mandelate racemase/muconate lactonizing enzyme family protein [Spirosoma radiotolerans]|uniref:Dipeptide epimerase n=1 Tax=Spirosoma radiotolerans TaxID=1379870 RepID=A0A0E3V6Y7_9BACT|nr:dipeptide epimerase [Spirosoma radiotolerans]AKD55417.1 chloromuconate cycloisomerase [Spirosoma radiotolerans]